MKFRKSLLALPLVAGLAACGSDDNPSAANSNTSPDGQTSPATSGQGQSLVTTYNFDSAYVNGESSVTYTGQTKRHLLISELTSAIKALPDDVNQDVVTDLNFYFDFDGAASDTLNYSFSKGGQALTPGPKYGDISSGKSLSAKIAGNDPALINGEFFGWEEGMDADPTPEELVDYFFAQLASLAQDGTAEQVTITGGSIIDIDVNYLSAEGLDYAQLVQKFLLGAITFSQGTGDYLQTDFSTGNHEAAAGENYSFPQHKWDEAFGYFGAARDYNDYTDDEIRASGSDRRAEYANGYHDSNGDGLIDLRSELNWGNSTNCAKRDAGATVATDFTKTAFDAFVAGRAILNQAENLTAGELAALRVAGLTASVTWEKCIAATVIHYINDTLADMDNFTADNAYADLSAFKDHAKHWGEMKGFALGLQFNPDSPFRADAASLDKLKQALTLMGDAPVLADGTQNGVAFTGGVAQYKADLIVARDLMEEVYGFDADNVANW